MIVGLKSFAILLLRHWVSIFRGMKHARGNKMPSFMTKDFSNNIMKRSQLRNKHLKNNNEENRKLYAKQKNYCVSLQGKSLL